MAVFRRISNLFRRSRVDREIDAELQSHIELRIEDNIARGMTPGEARRDALAHKAPVAEREYPSGGEGGAWRHPIGR